MLEFITGGAFSTRETLLQERIKKAAQEGRDVLCIIPDQYSFEFDRQLYSTLGAKLFNRIKTAGFNRLSDLLAKEYGLGGESCDDRVRTLFMYKAIRALGDSGNVRYYKKELSKASFVGECDRLIMSLRQSGISPDMMRASAEKHGGSLGAKLSDLAFIYESFLGELSAHEMTDSLSALAGAVEQARTHGYFLGKSVFISAFTSFTSDEYKMCETALSQCSDMTVSLLLDEQCISAFHSHPFADTVKTRQKLRDMASACGAEVRNTVCEESGEAAPELLFLSKNLYNYNKKPYEGKNDAVTLVSASDIYEECDYICSQIKYLVREKGYAYSDIAVIVRDLSQPAPVLESAFERYEIPYFTDCGESAETSALVRYVNMLFKCLLTTEYRTENIIKLIKSPMYPMKDIDVFRVENYCYVWGVDRELWKQDFIPEDEEEQEELPEGRLSSAQYINELRKQIITPLESFKAAIGEKPTAKGISEALYDLFVQIGLSKQAYSYLKRAADLDPAKGVEQARALRQLWGSVISVVGTICKYLGEEPISLRRYCELFSSMTAQLSVSKPPQKLDCVILCTAGHSRTGLFKAVFAAEMNDGIFPANVSSGELLGEFEKQLLERDDMVIGQSARSSFLSEKLICYSALTSASERLYALWSCCDLLGETKRPSTLANDLISMFGKTALVNTALLPPSEFVSSYKTAYYKYLENIASKDTDTRAIRALVTLSGEYSEKLASHNDIHEDGSYSLSPETAEKLFFREEKTNISPTQLETYFKCPFSYFCKYGLGLSTPSKKEIGFSDRGLIVHELLQRLVDLGGEDAPKGYAASKMTDEELEAFVSECVDDYIERKLGGSFGKPVDFDFIVAKLGEFALEAARFVRAELGGTKFTPLLLEYKLDTEKEQLELDAGGGKKMILSGTIDRADIYKDDSGEIYVRVIDYKTGTSTSFAYSKLYNGLNLQMLVYLTALLESDSIPDVDKSKLRQAGIIYYIFGKKPKSFEQTASEEADGMTAEKKLLDSFKPEGRTVDAQNVLRAYNEEDSYAYVPYKVSQKTGISEQAITTAQFTALRTFAKNKTEAFGHDLKDGHISARPLDRTCTYCEYTGICGLVNRDNAIDTSDKAYDELMRKEIARLTKEGEE